MKTFWLAVALAVSVASTSSLAAEQTRSQFSGTVTATDVKASALTVQGGTASRTFLVASDTVVVTSGNSDATLSDLKAGDRVNVSFTNERGTFTAHRIECVSTGEVQ